MKIDAKPLILIVDDTPTNLSVLGSLLSRQAYRIGFASSGQQALHSLQQKRPDLILLDVMMPDMDGFAVCRQIKNTPELADIPIIFLTAKTDKKAVVLGFELGAVDYISKPFDKDELLMRVKTQLELYATKQALSQALQVKNRFFSIIAHDLGNLFNGLVGLSSQLAGQQVQLSDAEKQQYIQYLFEGIGNGHALLKNLLDWSRLQTNRFQCEPMAIDVRHLLQRNLRFIREKAELKQLQINIEVADGVDSVFADEQMLNTVMRNLLSNAVKFTPTAGEIHLRSQKLAHNVVEIAVADTGVGMERDAMDKLFKIDVHYSTVGTSGESGNGLGLSLCHELIEKNAGHLGVKSESGKGSCFYLHLPITAEK